MSIPQSGGCQVENFDDLVGYLEAGDKPKSEWRIGTEHEKFGFWRETQLPIDYESGIRPILEGIRDRFGWTPVEEAGYLIGLVKDGANISLEPGGQLELSGAPLTDIFQTCDEAGEHLSIVRDVAEPLGIDFMGLGAAPVWQHGDMPVMPKGRYRLMTDYMKKVGTMGHVMMYRTATIQVNLDWSSEADMVRKFRMSLALQPVANALFANSPFFEGAPNGMKSWRGRVWQDTDRARTGMLPFVFEGGMGYERYADYALDVPMYFVYRDGKYIDATGQSFRDFLRGELPALPGEKPTLSDLADHLTTIFPEVRIKKFMEMRGADSGPWGKICALPAFWVGLFYDQNALDAAWDLVKDWTAEERETLRLDAAKYGLEAEIRGRKVLDIARDVLEISEKGLNARNIASRNGQHASESYFLEPLKEMVARGGVLADEILAKYHGEWAGDVSKIYQAYRYY